MRDLALLAIMLLTGAGNLDTRMRHTRDDTYSIAD